MTALLAILLTLLLYVILMALVWLLISNFILPLFPEPFRKFIVAILALIAIVILILVVTGNAPGLKL